MNKNNKIYIDSILLQEARAKLYFTEKRMKEGQGVVSRRGVRGGGEGRVKQAEVRYGCIVVNPLG